MGKAQGCRLFFRRCLDWHWFYKPVQHRDLAYRLRIHYIFPHLRESRRTASPRARIFVLGSVQLLLDSRSGNERKHRPEKIASRDETRYVEKEESSKAHGGREHRASSLNGSQKLEPRSKTEIREGSSAYMKQALGYSAS